MFLDFALFNSEVNLFICELWNFASTAIEFDYFVGNGLELKFDGELFADNDFKFLADCIWGNFSAFSSDCLAVNERFGNSTFFGYDLT